MFYDFAAEHILVGKKKLAGILWALNFRQMLKYLFLTIYPRRNFYELQILLIIIILFIKELKRNTTTSYIRPSKQNGWKRRRERKVMGYRFHGRISEEIKQKGNSTFYLKHYLIVFVVA